MPKELLPGVRTGMAVARSERQAVVAIQQAQLDGAVRAARGVAKAQAVSYVSRSAVDGLGQVAAEAEYVINRSPWVANEAIDLTHRAARALGDVIDAASRW
jgi:hypothetical protein